MLSHFHLCIITEHLDGRDDFDDFCGDVDPRDPTMNPDDIEDPRAEACGRSALTSPVPAGGDLHRPTAFVFATHVDPSTSEVCLASTGVFGLDLS